MGFFDGVAGTERPNKMPAGRKPTGINCRNRGRANDGGSGSENPPSSIPGGTRWVRPYSLGRAEGGPDRGHEKSAAVFTGRSNDPTLALRKIQLGHLPSSARRGDFPSGGLSGMGSGHQKPASVGPG